MRGRWPRRVCWGPIGGLIDGPMSNAMCGPASPCATPWCGGLVTRSDHHEIGCCRDVSLAVVLSLVTASQGTAQSVDLKGRRNAAPSFNDLGLRLWAAGALSGLGNDDVVIGRSAHGDVTSLCTNQGGNQVRTPGATTRSLPLPYRPPRAEMASPVLHHLRPALRQGRAETRVGRLWRYRALKPRR
jgi:hypothetical protein